MYILALLGLLSVFYLSICPQIFVVFVYFVIKQSQCTSFFLQDEKMCDTVIYCKIILNYYVMIFNSALGFLTNSFWIRANRWNKSNRAPSSSTSKLVSLLVKYPFKQMAPNNIIAMHQPISTSFTGVRSP